MKIELSDTEITHIMDSLRERVNDLREDHSISGDIETADLANELEELEHDGQRHVGHRVVDAVLQVGVAEPLDRGGVRRAVRDEGQRRDAEERDASRQS